MGSVDIKLGVVETAKNKTVLEEEALKKNLAVLLKEINEQQTFAESDAATTSYSSLNLVMSPVNSQIAAVMAMKVDVGNMDAEMTEQNQNLTKRIELLDEGRKKWRGEAKALHKRLEVKANTKIITEKVDIVTIQKSLKEVCARVC